MHFRGARVHVPSARSVAMIENVAVAAGLITLYAMTGSMRLVLIVLLLYLTWYIAQPFHRG
jgi:hypothetical protein